MSKRTYIFLVGWAVAVVGMVAAYVERESIQVWLDRRGLQDYATEMMTQPVGPPPQAQELRLATHVLDAPTLAAGQPPLSFPGTVAEVWTFRSPVGDGAVGDATFWVFRGEDLGARPAVIWLPGNGFGELAYPFVKGFYERILQNGYDLIVWVPPYHLNRAGSGDRGILTANTSDNLRVLFGSISEIRTMVRFLRQRGVTKLGGWGGSMGASIVWLTSSLEKFDFLSLMIPVVDWRTVTISPQEMAPLTARIEASGTDARQLDDAYKAVSPISYASLTPGTQVQIQYATFDQLTPAELTEDFGHQIGVMALQSYPRSHATILLTPELYEDFGEFLRRR